MMENFPVERLILVVEDNPDHVATIQKAFSENASNHRLLAIASGAEALDFLNRRGQYQDAPRPDLILLDLNLPGKDGREILAEIKSNPHLKRIPIIVLTLSDREEDIFRSYSMQGNCYVIKSSDLDQLLHIVRRIEEFWLGIVTLPLE
mgnify:CR=1 FL=1